MRIENLLPLKLNKLTQKQFDREKNAGNIEGTGLYLTPDTSVSFEPQELPAEKQAQARANIGAVPAGHVDKYIATTSEAHMLTLVLAYCENSATEPGRIYRILVEFTPTGSTFEFKPGTWLFEITKSSTSDVRHIKATNGSNAIMFTYDGSSTSAFEHGVIREDLAPLKDLMPVDFSDNVLLYSGYVLDQYPNITGISAAPMEYFYFAAARMVFFRIVVSFSGTIKAGDILRFPYYEKAAGGVFVTPREGYSYPITTNSPRFYASHWPDCLELRVARDFNTLEADDFEVLSGWFVCD